MPYIKTERRTAILEGDTMKNAGELNFAITSALIDSTSLTDAADRYAQMAMDAQRIAERYLHAEPLTYQRINDAVGALFCAAGEYRRRVGDAFVAIVLGNVAALIYNRTAVPYEIAKIEENGDLPFKPIRK
jgi:hypothetical protein